MKYSKVWRCSNGKSVCEHNSKREKTIDEVPDRIRDAVRQILIDKGYPELAESEGATK